MQPGTNPEDINVILNRFQTWARKHPAEGNGNGHSNGARLDEVREIPYEEAIRQDRNRRAARAPRPRTAPAANSAAPAQPTSAVKAAPPATPEVAPPTQQRFISSLEILAALNNIAPAPPLQDAAELPGPLDARSTPHAAVQDSPRNPVQPTVEAVAQTAIAKSSRAKRPVAAKTATIPAPKPPADFGQLLAEAVTHSAPDASPMVPPKSARKVARSSHPKTETHGKKAASAHLRPPATTTKASAIAQRKTKARPAAAIRYSLIRPLTAIAADARSPAPGKSAPPAGATARPSKPAPSRQFMVGSKTQAAPKKAPAPDRTRRITTRFSAAEERRIEKQAAGLGLNVSAYLRQCALGALPAQIPPASETRNAMPSRRHKPHAQTLPNLTYSAPAPSLLGGWLALLRNRFLGPPARFSNDA